MNAELKNALDNINSLYDMMTKLQWKVYKLENRDNPEPAEYWINHYENGTIDVFDAKEKAMKHRKKALYSVEFIRMIHVRDVEE